MKRKVKFQEGGAVEEPARRSAIRNEPVGARLRRLFAARPPGPRAPVNREVGGPREQEDRARMAAEAAAQFDAEERALAERRAAQRAALTNRPSRITNRPVGAAMFGGPAAPAPVPTPAALARGRDMQAADVPGNRGPIVRRAMDAEGSEVAAAAERRRQEANRPRPRPAPAPVRRELTMEEIRALRSGERAPRTSEERALIEGLRDLPQPRQRMSEADELNERELRRIRIEREAEEMNNSLLQRIRAQRQQEEEMGGSGNIGAASARERGEQVGPPGQYNMKKGGKVPKPKAKPVAKKAGGMIGKPKAAPKKMMKGGMTAMPKPTVNKSKSKPMPFKKGGVIKKGRK